MTVAEVRIKKMTTRWGSCNAEARRIWLNLELVKKPALCQEYILVHEMVHILERHHNERLPGVDGCADAHVAPVPGGAESSAVGA